MDMRLALLPLDITYIWYTCVHDINNDYIIYSNPCVVTDVGLWERSRNINSHLVMAS